MCYKECPNGTLVNDYLCEDNICNENNKKSLECLDNTPQVYYLDSKDGIYKKCFKNCKFCSGQGKEKEKENNCVECKSNFTFLNDSNYINNYFKKYNYFYYFGESNEYHFEEMSKKNIKNQ